MRYLPISAVAVAIAAMLAIALADAVSSRQHLWAHAAATTGGDPYRGKAMFIQYGCGSCHAIDHMRQARGMVGPPLDGVAMRSMIAGKLPNQPDNLTLWIRDPQSVTPGSAMPDLHVSDRDARDISAFLYTRIQ